MILFSTSYPDGMGPTMSRREAFGVHLINQLTVSVRRGTHSGGLQGAHVTAYRLEFSRGTEAS